MNNMSISTITNYLINTNRKFKKFKKNYKKLKRLRDIEKNKIDDIKELLSNINYYFDKYDNPSDSESYRLLGKVELKEEILKILGDKK